MCSPNRITLPRTERWSAFCPEAKLGKNTGTLVRKALFPLFSIQKWEYAEGFSQVDENVRQRLSSIYNNMDRNLESNLFADENGIKQFFDKAGFDMEEYSHSKVLADLSSVRLLNFSQEEILNIRKGLKMLKTLILTRNT